jgi:hypothetical protein
MPKLYTSIHYGDVHFPFQDDAALAVLHETIALLKPNMIVCHGDLLDCYAISKYEKDIFRRPSLANEILQAQDHFRHINSLAPRARKLFLKGNHEDRLQREIRRMAAKPEALEILRLPGVAGAMTWPELLELQRLGWEYHDRRTLLFDRLVLKHGSKVRPHGAYSAKAEYEHYRKSGISGHTHRRGVHEARDYNGTHAWWEHGCLCNIDPEYTEDPNWQQGFLVVTWSDDRSAFGVEEVRIHDGTAVFRGRLLGHTEPAGELVA